MMIITVVRGGFWRAFHVRPTAEVLAAMAAFYCTQISQLGGHRRGHKRW